MDCWLWNGPRDQNGYGHVSWRTPRQHYVRKTGSIKAHRLVFTALVGAIPPGMELDHLCRNPGCVNPDHLEIVTRAENNRRAGGPRVKGKFMARKRIWIPWLHRTVEVRTGAPDRRHRLEG